MFFGVYLFLKERINLLLQIYPERKTQESYRWYKINNSKIVKPFKANIKLNTLNLRNNILPMRLKYIHQTITKRGINYTYNKLKANKKERRANNNCPYFYIPIFHSLFVEW